MDRGSANKEDFVFLFCYVGESSETSSILFHPDRTRCGLNNPNTRLKGGVLLIIICIEKKLDINITIRLSGSM